MSRRGAPYVQFSPTFWQMSKRAKWQNDTVLLATYLLTGPWRTTEGLYQLPLEYIVVDLPAGWKKTRVVKALRQLEAAGFCVYDYDTEVVLLPEALKIQSPKSANQMTGALRKLAALPNTRLMQGFLSAAREHAKEFYDFIKDSRPDLICHDIAHGIAHPQTQAPARPTHTSNSLPHQPASDSNKTSSSVSGAEGSAPLAPNAASDARSHSPLLVSTSGPGASGSLGLNLSMSSSHQAHGSSSKDAALTPMDAFRGMCSTWGLPDPSRLSQDAKEADNNTRDVQSPLS